MYILFMTRTVFSVICPCVQYDVYCLFFYDVFLLFPYTKLLFHVIS